MSKRAQPAPIWQLMVVSLALVGAVWIVFGQTVGYQFVNFDDGTYVYRNPQVLRGISIEGAKWAFTHTVAANWHPVTMLSHMLDCQIYGVAPGGHHFVNVALHAIAAVLLFLVFWRMTRALWQSAFVAAVFAIHPLHVESVAWIAERKDVLSAVFFMLTLGSYVRFVRRSNVLNYSLVLICFALGLMSKPMLVTLPFLLLLLDYWPLNRLERSTTRALILEKVPLFFLSALACAEALISQHQSINLVTTMSLGARIGNAFQAIMIYLWQTIYPVNLAVFYPHPQGGVFLGKTWIAVMMFVAISGAAVAARKKTPYVLIGWLWFVGMLVPVLGVVQVGIQAHADRYTYLPQIGLALAVAWIVANISRKWSYRSMVLTVLAAVALIPLIWTARLQASHWHEGQSLWEHAIAVTADNEVARVHLSDAYLQNGRIEDALTQARLAVNMNSDSAESEGVLGAALARKGDLDEAIKHLRAAAELDAILPQVYYNLGNVFLQRGQLDDAINNYEKEIRSANLPEAHNNLALALLRKGEVNTAIEHLNVALEQKPDYPDARNNLAIALSQTGKMSDAIAQWQKTLRLQPDNLQAECNLVWIYATFPDSSIRDGTKAVELARRAIRLSGGKDGRIWRLAAAAYAEAGQFPQAIQAAQTGLRLAEAEGNGTLVETIRSNLALYQSGSPLRDVGQSR